jgi:hemerythrin-like domain-containing protein
MNVVDALTGEHGVLRKQVEALAAAAPAASDEALRAFATALVETLESHAELEDRLLFDDLAASGRIPPGPVEAMREEHEQIVAYLAQLTAPAGVPGGPEPRRTVLRLAEAVRQHFAHEEHALFPMACQALPAQRLEELGALWAEARGVALRAHAGVLQPAS